MKTELSLTEQEVSDAVVEYIAKHYNVELERKSSVRFKYGTRLEGFGPMECERAYFDGAVCQVVSKFKGNGKVLP